MSPLDESVISARLGEYIADARFAEALELLDRCLILGTNDPWLHGMRALLLLETGDTTGALKSSATAVQQARELDPTNAWAIEGLVITNTKLLPVHRRWVAVAWGRVVRRREETTLIGAVAMSSLALVLFGLGRSGIVLTSVITAAAAALPMLDAWRREVVTR